MRLTHIFGILFMAVAVMVGCATDPGATDGGATTSDGGTELTATDGAATDGAATDGGQADQAAECELGTTYPDRIPIDPDDPGDYSETGWSNADVLAAFAEAKDDNNEAYQAYAFARDHADLLECPFCACGCATMDVEHLSAVDCFKDMHGFT